MTRLPCTACGELIHPDTAAKNDGLCMPCKGGYIEQIEEGKRQREREREWEKSLGRLYWLALVDRVYKTAEGFAGLKPEEKTYFALRCLIGEVYNGGFYQYFSNSAGNQYAHALDGLIELEAMQSLQLLTQAKQLLLGEHPVPVDQDARDEILPDLQLFDTTLAALATALDDLDRKFYADPEQLGDRCTAFAHRHRLYGEP